MSSFQLCANGILLLAANILGLASYLLSDKQQRRAFLETRQSLEMKMLMEEQSDEQVKYKLLLMKKGREFPRRNLRDVMDHGGATPDSFFTEPLYRSLHALQHPPFLGVTFPLSSPCLKKHSTFHLSSMRDL